MATVRVSVTYANGMQRDVLWQDARDIGIALGALIEVAPRSGATRMAIEFLETGAPSVDTLAE